MVETQSRLSDCNSGIKPQVLEIRARESESGSACGYCEEAGGWTSDVRAG